MEELVNRNYRAELFGEELYSALARDEKSEKVREVLQELSEGEGRHAKFWESIAMSRGIKLRGLGFLDRLKLWILRRLRKVLGLALVLKMVEAGEENDAEKYYRFSTSQEFTDTERQGFRDIMMQEMVHEDMLIQTQVNVDTVRDTIYAISDGLIEVLASVSGLAGIFSVPLYVALGGLIVGVSGMISMSIGAYLSAKSEEDIRNNALRKARLRSLLEGEKREEDQEVSRTGESVRTTAISYIMGAIIPILPFLLGLGGLVGLVTSYAVTGVATFIVGALIGILSDVSPWRKGAVMTGLALGAALVTHVLGLLAHLAGFS
ncbi:MULTISPECIES: VIT1/CCC1 family protein [Metallosphaera]|uniref:VIT1/CCC1 transporter family protein n=1 Tax=Metallosphaera TaxID=41980 RepID=UPI001F0689CD|nr:VIT1/CCC1 family protein [Metallosphaera sedula]MCH1772046.1 VIT1/CCC1 family protein [Metallosphaera sedula]MCP6729858.1 VIT1/CCC1 family protein [Metallosphaera sedula]